MDITEAFEQYSAPIYRYIFRKVNNPELADDLTQDTFEQALHAWPGVRPATAKSWLYRVAHNLVVDYLRRANIVAWTQLDDAGHVHGQDDIKRCEEREHIEATLSSLKPKYARALWLWFDGESLPQKHLAMLYGDSVQNFKTHVSRGRRLFAVAYEQKGA